MLINTSPSYLVKNIFASTADSSIKDITSPKGILEHIINFITFGKIRKDKEFFYKEIMKKIEISFSGVTAKEMEDGRKIHLDDINGCKVSFYYTDHTNKVTVEVKNNNKSESQEIDSKKFFNTFQALKLQALLNITCIKDILTDDGVINLKGVNLSDTDLKGAYLRDADLSDTNLSNADLSDANLTNANLSNADLKRADLSEANLTNANLNKADLERADLERADLSEANLTSANLNNADLERAVLSDAILTGANLLKINVVGANMAGTKPWSIPTDKLY
ncbi:pentapeptide repeat-containing protein [Candidatus Symbiopectobacterium sp.]|uniref:pentapeptide repeat-containing protein n=1 Tax=Candidatus Symbiopectobacterium sp. TaxID=2816440 RepID=UPI0025C480F9|nr:pentapeptide repeat-containing protein [Candidatus Symbiopectobacterium sp.]